MPRLLLVERDLRYAPLLEWFLEQYGYEVTTVGSPGEALQLIEGVDFGVWVVDHWGSEMMDGVGFIAEARKRGHWTVAIILTRLLPMMVEARVAGLDVYAVVARNSIPNVRFPDQLAAAVELTDSQERESRPAT